MKRIDSPDERFHDGNPATGELGTLVRADWLNAVQEEIATVIESAGLAIDDEKSDQLRQAIGKIIGSTQSTDADKLDGEEGTFYRNAGNLNAGTLPKARLSGSYDISISGKAANADELGGQPGSYYRNAGNLNSGTVPKARLSGSYDISISGNAATATNASKLGGQAGSYYRNANNLNAGTVPAARLSGSYDISISGKAANADELGGQPGSYYRNASNLNAGTVPKARLSGSYDISISGKAANADELGGQPGSYYRNASNLNAGTVPAARLPASATVSTSSVLNALKGASVGAVGTYALLKNKSNAMLQPGDTIGGSNLEYTSLRPVGGGLPGKSPGGTWRCMGYTNDGGASREEERATLFLRIS